jgi:RNA-directed DNA polymerase
MENSMNDIDASLAVVPSVNTDEQVRVFQRKLYLLAKQERHFKAYSLYDKLCQPHFLTEAYRRVRKGKSKEDGGGVDGQTFQLIEQKGLAEFLEEIRQSLLTRSYRPQAVRRVLIPKAGSGKMRPLGIPTIRDRVVQMVVKMAIEPLWEADFIDTSYGFRPKKSARHAITKIRDNIYEGYKFVYDADLSSYFDTIPHEKLFILLRERLRDGSVLDLIAGWLKAPVRHEDGRMERTEKGTPQGGVISPLLANIYLHAFDRIVSHPKSVFGRAGIRIVRYADDFVLMGRQRYSPQVLRAMHQLLGRMGLSLNKDKTRILHTGSSSLHFLGFEFRSVPSKFSFNKRNYTNIRPSPKSRSKLYGSIRELLGRVANWTIETMVPRLGELLLGWLNYFSITKVSHIWDTVKQLKTHLDYKLYKWLKRKGRSAHRSIRQRPYEYLVRFKNLLDIEKYARFKTLAKA